jgi:hypothetical protein
MEEVMSPSIDITPDLLGMFKQQDSALPASAAAELETLCAALDLLQTGAQADLNALAGCLSSLSDWLKNQQASAPDDASGWTSEPFGVMGMGGMLTCRSDRWEVIFNQDGSGQPYMGMWQSRLPGETNRSGSFKIKASDGGTLLVLEGSRPLQVSLPGFGAAAWGSLGALYQGLNSSRQPDSPAADPPPPPVQGLPVLPSPPNIADGELSPDATPTILAKPAKRQTSPVPLPSENAGRKPVPGEQPAMINPKPWKCACGSKNTGQFCPKCGSKKLAPVIEQKSAPAQPSFCRRCGKVLSSGARFCRNCGTEVRG